MKKLIFLFSIALAIVVACEPPEEYPDIPAIAYKEFIFKDTVDQLDNPIKLCRLVFECIDGDGDMGLSQADTVPPYDTSSVYYHNCFIVLFEKKNGEYSQIKMSIEHNYRIRYEEIKGCDKTYKATISVDMEYPIYLFNYDTIKYEFFVVDRALHESNIVVSPDLDLIKEEVDKL